MEQPTNAYQRVWVGIGDGWALWLEDRYVDQPTVDGSLAFSNADFVLMPRLIRAGAGAMPDRVITAAMRNAATSAAESPQTVTDLGQVEGPGWRGSLTHEDIGSDGEQLAVMLGCARPSRPEACERASATAVREVIGSGKAPTWMAQPPDAAAGPSTASGTSARAPAPSRDAGRVERNGRVSARDRRPASASALAAAMAAGSPLSR